MRIERLRSTGALRRSHIPRKTKMSIASIVLLSVAGVSGILLLITLFKTFFTVEQQTVSIVERFGKFQREAGPGLQLKVPFVDRIAQVMDLRIQQLDVKVETKTSDNVFVTVIVSVQYYVLPGKVYDAYYKLDNPERQITSFVFDVVRAKVPNLKLDDVFEKKDDVADAVKTELAQVMDDFGYGIVKALVTDIDPDSRVKAAMNEINASQRMRAAAAEKGEADKILLVKAAEAEAESKALQGKGIADQRKAIVDGLKESVEAFQAAVKGAGPQEVITLVLLTQYFDALERIGTSGKSSTILLPHSPSAVHDLARQLQESMLAADAASKSTAV